ncbi:N-acyl-D-amino-acid deacylase family protein [Minwuia sp.]|uniref:N-acyl-D-amino-acid deacylase family protein n=1 Tax=Minwuia sp. TaxID=2493630 RepID=UPI003A918440
MLDLKIENGLIVDGTGSEGYRGSVGIKDGKVVALGNVTGDAERTIDAKGHVVAPGFVDIHTHYDAQVVWDRMLSISPWHGVTTAVMGNCGFAVAPTRPNHRDLIMRTLENVEGMSVDALKQGLGDWGFESFPEYLDVLEKLGTAINISVFCGHTPLRLYVMGEEATEREATPEEVAEMKRLVEEAMDAGAIGFATSKAVTHTGYAGRPVPSRLASLEEIEILAGVLGEKDKGILQATIGRDLFIPEFEKIARDTGRPVTWTALLSGTQLADGTAEEHLQRTRELKAEGLDVVPQVTPRALMFEIQMKAPFIFEPVSVFKPVRGASFEEKKRLYADPDFRDAFRHKLSGNIRPGFQRSFDMTIIADVPGHPEWAEKTLEEVAAERGQPMTDALLDMSLETDLEARFRMPVANHDEAEVEPLLKEKATVIGLSDAGAHASQLCDACLPTHLLGRWVREKKVFSIEEAVRMLTSRPAEVFGITDRGTLAEGRPADIVIFDPETVGCGPVKRVWDFPAGADRLISEADGIDAVVVNGTVIRQNGADAVDAKGSLPGKLLRGGRA